MFLIKDRRMGMDHFVFTVVDPREGGYEGTVLEGVELEYDMNAIHLWPIGEPRPNPQLGRNLEDPKKYRVFKFQQEREAAGYDFVHFNTPFVAYSWADYRNQYYPVPEEFAKAMTQEEWFDYLEEADFATKIRQKMAEQPEPTAHSSRDEVAQWVARQHMGADGAIHQVWYLPTGAPADEIRLLEASDRYGGFATIKPLDFGLDIDGAKYKLLVADVTSEQLDKVKNGATVLPNGWVVDSAKVWGRRP